VPATYIRSVTYIVDKRGTVNDFNTESIPAELQFEIPEDVRNTAYGNTDNHLHGVTTQETVISSRIILLFLLVNFNYEVAYLITLLGRQVRTNLMQSCKT
jgi:hypothetical protein